LRPVPEKDESQLDDMLFSDEESVVSPPSKQESDPTKNRRVPSSGLTNDSSSEQNLSMQMRSSPLSKVGRETSKISDLFFQAIPEEESPCLIGKTGNIEDLDDLVLGGHREIENKV